MDFKDLQAKSASELRELLKEKTAEFNRWRFQSATQPIKQVHLFRVAKRTLARLKFLLSQKA